MELNKLFEKQDKEFEENWYLDFPTFYLEFVKHVSDNDGTPDIQIGRKQLQDDIGRVLKSHISKIRQEVVQHTREETLDEVHFTLQGNFPLETTNEIDKMLREMKELKPLEK